MEERMKEEKRKLEDLGLQFKKEFQRFPAGGAAGFDGLRLQPSLPLPDDQDFRFLLLHNARPICEPGRALVVALVFLRAQEGRSRRLPLVLRPERCCFRNSTSLEDASPKAASKVSGRRADSPHSSLTATF